MSLRERLDDGVLELTLDRPDRYNAIDAELREALIDQFDHAPERGVRAILLQGSGKGFCAGADLKEGGAPVVGIDLESFLFEERAIQALLSTPNIGGR